MKLSELKPEEEMKVLVYGDPGTWKTVFACSFPTPILFLDFDGKADSAAAFYKGDERLTQIELRNLAANMHSDPIHEFNEILEKELIPQQKAGKMEYATIVLDSLTTFSHSVLQHIVKTNPGTKRNTSKQGVQPGMQDFGILKREFVKLIPGLLSLPCNVVMTGHIDVKQDELTGQINRIPMMDGSFGQELPVYFKEVYVTEKQRDGSHLAVSQSPQYKVRSQIKGLPAKFPLSYEELIKAR